MPAAAADAAGPTPSTSPSWTQHATPAAHTVAADLSVRSAGRVSARGDVQHGATTRIDAPAHVRLLAARLYWGARPPAYPSATSLRSDLRRTSKYFAHVSRGRQHVRA